MKLLLEFCQLLSAEIRADRAGGASGSILGESACNVKTGRQQGERTRRPSGRAPVTIKVTAQRSWVPVNTVEPREPPPRGEPPWNSLHAWHIFQVGMRGSESVFGTRSLGFASSNNASEALPPQSPNRRLEGQWPNAASAVPRRRLGPQPQKRPSVLNTHFSSGRSSSLSSTRTC